MFIPTLQFSPSRWPARDQPVQPNAFVLILLPGVVLSPGMIMSKPCGQVTLGLGHSIKTGQAYPRRQLYTHPSSAILLPAIDSALNCLREAMQTLLTRCFLKGIGL